MSVLSPNLIAELLPTPGADFATVLNIVSALDAAGWASVTIRTGAGAFEPLTLLASLATHCHRIGLVAEVNPEELAPYSAARRLAALDHVSNGRAGWQFTSQASEDLARDYALAVVSLWDGWEEGAHLIDRGAGRYIDVTKVHRSNYQGSHFRVAGPLDIPPPLQGHAVRYGTHPDLGVEVVTTDTTRNLITSLHIVESEWRAAIDANPSVAEVLGAPASLRERLLLPRPTRRTGATS